MRQYRSHFSTSYSKAMNQYQPPNPSGEENLSMLHSLPDSLEIEGRLIKLLQSPLSLLQVMQKLDLDLNAENIQAVDRALNELIENGTVRRYSIEKLSHWIVVSDG